jgi:hypothetical protein
VCSGEGGKRDDEVARVARREHESPFVRVRARAEEVGLGDGVVAVRGYDADAPI